MKPLTCGTSDLEQIIYPVIMAPFFGAVVPVMIRELTQAQILSCGDFSLIETFQDKIAAQTKNVTMKEIIEYSERQHAIVREALVSPTYEQILKAFDCDAKIKETKEKLEALKSRVEETPRGPKRAELEEEIASMRIWCEYVLPDDFLAFVVGYTLGIDKSDIKKVSEEMLLNAAILAERGKDNPADHLDGRFTSFMKDDINRRAWAIHRQWQEENKRSK